MNIPAWKVDLWNAINKYVQTCGGDPSKHVYGNMPRQLAVVDVEKAVADAVAEAVAAEREACAKAVAKSMVGGYHADDPVKAIRARSTVKP